MATCGSWDLPESPESPESPENPEYLDNPELPENLESPDNLFKKRGYAEAYPLGFYAAFAHNDYSSLNFGDSPYWLG